MVRLAWRRDRYGGCGRGCPCGPGFKLSGHQQRGFERRAWNGKQCDPCSRPEGRRHAHVQLRSCRRSVRNPDAAQRAGGAALAAGRAIGHERLLRRREGRRVRFRVLQRGCRRGIVCRFLHAGGRAPSRSAAAARRSAKLLGGTWTDAGNVEMADVAGIVLDAGVPAPNRGSAAPRRRLGPGGRKRADACGRRRHEDAVARRTHHGRRAEWGRDRQRGQRRRGRIQLQGSARDHGRRPGPGRSTA